MDTPSWVLKAVETLHFANEKDIMHWLDEEGEAFSKTQLQHTLEALIKEGKLELRNDMFRLCMKPSKQAAFNQLFSD
jgi:hypothetical protein